MVTELHVVKNDSNETANFLDYLYDGLEGWVYTPTKESDGKFDQHFFRWPQERDQLVEHVTSNTSEREVYVAPAIFDSPVGLGKHVKASNVLWAEFDGNTPTTLPDDIPSPTYRVQSSGEGHEHWYWKLSEPITSATAIESANRSITYALHADTSGWDANQVLRPPGTINHKRGGLSVTTRETSETTYPFVGFSTVPQAPEPLAEISGIIPDVADIILKYAWPDEAIKVFRMTKDTVPTGDGRGRNVALVHLGYYCAEMGMGDLEIFSVLRNADDRWGKYKDRNDRNKRLTSIIERVRVKYPEVVFADDEVIPVLGFQDLLDTEIEIEWVIPGLLQEQGYMLFTGPSGIGKTQVTLRMAMAMALGRPWLGFEIDKARKVLFLSLEMGHPDLKYFIQMMSEGLSEQDRATLQSNLILVPYGEPIYLDTERGKRVFESIVEDVRPDGIFIDSVGSTSTGNVSSEETVKKLVDYNDHVRKKYGVFTWWIHHMRKAQAENKKPNKLDDVYGNQYLYNRATSVYALWGKGTKIEVLPLKKRLAKVEEPWEIQRLVNLDFTRVSSGEEMFQKPTALEYKAPETPNKSEKEKKSDDLMGGM